MVLTHKPHEKQMLNVITPFCYRFKFQDFIEAFRLKYSTKSMALQWGCSKVLRGLQSVLVFF